MENENDWSLECHRRAGARPGRNQFLPVLGASRIVPPSYKARAQAITQSNGSDGIVSPNRGRALRECNDRVDGFAEHI